MTDAKKYAKVFRAAGLGVMEPYKTDWSFSTDGLTMSTTGLTFDGRSFTMADREQAKQIQSVMYAIADVFEKIAEEQV